MNHSPMVAAQLALLNKATITIADLADGYLALTSGTTITLDTDAAGYGWFVDPTPFTNEEFVNGWSMVDGQSARTLHLGNSLPSPTARPRARWISSPPSCMSWGTCWAMTITPSIHH
jgi:hypothetical protein